MGNKNKRILVWIIGILLVGGGLTVVVKTVMDVNNYAKDNPVTISRVSTDGNHLVAEKYLNKLGGGEAYQSPGRNPVAVLSFDSAYHLLIYKIDLAEDMSLSNLLNTQEVAVYPSNMEIYNVVHGNLGYLFRYHGVATKPVSKIFLTLAGNPMKTVVKNDSIVNYAFTCENFSIRYGDKDPQDIMVVGPDRALGTTRSIPMNLLLLKRNKAVYLLVMTPVKYSGNIPDDLLYNVITGK